MKWKWILSEQFKEIEPEWQAIKQQCTDSILLDSLFVRQLIKHFGNGKEKVGICYDDDTPVAAGVFENSGSGQLQTFQPSQAPIGLWMVVKNADVNYVLSSLIKSQPLTHMMVGLLQQDPALSLKPSSSGQIKIIDYIKTSFIRIDGTFEEYWQKRSKNLKHNLKRQRNRLKKEGFTTRFDIIMDPDQIKTAVKEYGDLESQGWKGEQGTSIHVDNSQGRFYSDLLYEYARQDKAVVFKYWYNEKLVSVDLCLWDKGVLIILKTTYDETQKTSSPAFLMLQEIVEHIFETKKTQKIEFFGKVMDWHTKWIQADDIREMFHINYYRFTLVGRVHELLFKIKSATKK